MLKTYMKPSFSQTGYVPVTIELPPQVADAFQQHGYRWEPIIREVLEFSATDEIAESLLTLYFQLSQLLLLLPEEVSIPRPTLREHLYRIEGLYRAIRAMNEDECVDSSAGQIQP